MDRINRFYHFPRGQGHFSDADDLLSDLKLLYHDTNLNVEADLIFVAGLGGHFLGSWAKSKEVVWPRDLLHLHIKGLRVWSFHYNATLRGTSNLGKIKDHAGELLAMLQDKRREETDVSAKLRPIVFVGHSLGGMLIKQTILLAWMNPAYSPIWNAIRGVMFFAVPHHGLDTRAWEKFNVQVLRINPLRVGMVPTARMLQQAIDNSQVLLAITDEFRQLQEHLYFVNFTEGKLIQGMNYPLVDEGHGWMDAPRKFELKLTDGNHLDICQLGRTELKRDPNTTPHVVIEQLKELIGASKALEHIGEVATKAINSLCPRGFHGYFMAKQVTRGTCDWIGKRKEFKDWIGADNDGNNSNNDNNTNKNNEHEEENKESRMLWIQGPPRSGKSFLTRHIITDLIPPSSTRKVAHCFLDHAVPGRDSLQALLRATLHHALRVEPELIQHYLVPPYQEAVTRAKTEVAAGKYQVSAVIHDDDIWTMDILKPMWPDAVAQVTSRGLLMLVVDGFDVMSSSCRQGFLDCLDAFEAKAESPEHKARLKVLLVSGEDSENDDGGLHGGREQFQVYRLTLDDIEGDMTKVAVEALANASPPTEKSAEDAVFDSKMPDLDLSGLEDLGKRIARDSGGDFLLAKMAAEEYAVDPLLGSGAAERSKDIMKEDNDGEVPHVGDTPFDVDGIYRRILRRIHDDETYLPFVRHVLRWATFQMGPLLEPELDTAVALGMAQDQGQDQSSGCPIDTTELEALQEIVSGIRPRVLEMHLQRAVRIREGRLELVHESLRDHLVHGTRAAAEHDPDLDVSYLQEYTSHATLASICIAYLTMPYFADSLAPPAETLEAKIRERLERHPFARYASLHWFEHVEACKSNWAGVDEHIAHGRQLLRDNTTQYGICWSEMYWFLTNGTMHGQSKNTLDAIGQAVNLSQAQCARRATRHSPQPDDSWRLTDEPELVEKLNGRAEQIAWMAPGNETNNDTHRIAQMERAEGQQPLSPEQSETPEGSGSQLEEDSVFAKAIPEPDTPPATPRTLELESSSSHLEIHSVGRNTDSEIKAQPPRVGEFTVDPEEVGQGAEGGARAASYQDQGLDYEPGSQARGEESRPVPQYFDPDSHMESRPMEGPRPSSSTGSLPPPVPPQESESSKVQIHDVASMDAALEWLALGDDRGELLPAEESREVENGTGPDIHPTSDMPSLYPSLPPEQPTEQDEWSPKEAEQPPRERGKDSEVSDGNKQPQEDPNAGQPAERDEWSPKEAEQPPEERGKDNEVRDDNKQPQEDPSSGKPGEEAEVLAEKELQARADDSVEEPASGSNEEGPRQPMSITPYLPQQPSTNKAQSLVARTLDIAINSSGMKHIEYSFSDTDTYLRPRPHRPAMPIRANEQPADSSSGLRQQPNVSRSEREPTLPPTTPATPATPEVTKSVASSSPNSAVPRNSTKRVSEVLTEQSREGRHISTINEEIRTAQIHHYHPPGKEGERDDDDDHGREEEDGEETVGGREDTKKKKKKGWFRKNVIDPIKKPIKKIVGRAK